MNNILAVFILMALGLPTAHSQAAIKAEHHSEAHDDDGDRHGQGAIVIREDDGEEDRQDGKGKKGKVIAVTTPARNPKAQAAQDRNKGKAQSQPPALSEPPLPSFPSCPVPMALIIRDLTGSSDNVAANGGFFAFASNDPSGAVVDLGFLVLWNNQAFFLDRNVDSVGNALSIYINNPGWLSGSFVVHAGESISISYDNGQSLAIVFPIDISMAPGANSSTMFVDTTGKLYLDAALTQPLAVPTGCVSP